MCPQPALENPRDELPVLRTPQGTVGGEISPQNPSMSAAVARFRIVETGTQITDEIHPSGFTKDFHLCSVNQCRWDGARYLNLFGEAAGRASIDQPDEASVGGSH